MKTNHIPTVVRLRNRISNLKYRWDISRKISDYGYSCKICGQVDMYSQDHPSWCSAKGLLKQIAHYESLLQAAEHEAAVGVSV